MEQLHRLCFLVLLMPLVVQGQNTTHAMEQVTTIEPASIDNSSTWTKTNVSFSEVNSSLSEPTNVTFLENNNSTWEIPPVPTSEVIDSTRSSEKMDETSPSKEISKSPEFVVPTFANWINRLRHFKGSTTKEPLPSQTTSSWGYVVLAFIILVIVALSLILFFIRRAARSYSFDLHRPTPMNIRSEPTGTFEQVYLDDFERPDLKDLKDGIIEDTSSLPVANGTSPTSEEKGSSGEDAPQEQADEKGVESTSTSETSQTLGDNQDEKTAGPPVQTSLFLEAAGEQENENNNNPSICSSDPFVEINLDGPEWCDQLLSASQTSSTVTPFSILSSSPTSSISSSS